MLAHVSSRHCLVHSSSPGEDTRAEVISLAQQLTYPQVKYIAPERMWIQEQGRGQGT